MISQRFFTSSLQFRTSVCIFYLLLSPMPGFSQKIATTAQDRAVEQAVIGLWTAEIGNARLRIKIYDSGQYELDGARGSYHVQNASMVLTSDTGDMVTYSVAFSGRDTLSLSGGDLSQPIKFVRVQETAGVLAKYVRLTPDQIGSKAVTIGIIIIIALMSRLILGFLQASSGILIFSERGILKYIYKKNKNRRSTIHSLLLDLLKYIIYFTAFGFILSEIGVNYTAYLASLSVIGLAVGFGSQGLVQDVVTGFFIIFEGQFDVGDMVEISGQIGLVQNMGLRMTKIQNYLGQIMFVPNRNISVVGRYDSGALEGYVDVALDSESTYSEARSCLETLAQGVAKQFNEVFLRPPEVEPILVLTDSEVFIRTQVSIWPGQIWVVDQQLIPRIREAFSCTDIAIPGDRILTFYHVKREQRVRGMKDRLRSFARTRLQK